MEDECLLGAENQNRRDADLRNLRGGDHWGVILKSLQGGS
jgi:hypothetical protein